MDIIICITFLLLGVISLMVSEASKSNGNLPCYNYSITISASMFILAIFTLLFIIHVPVFNFIKSF